MQRYYDVVQDQDGKPVAGASITVYNAGVTNPLPTIYAVGGSDTPTAAQSNPITTDSLGRYAFAAPDGDYDIVISGAGISTYTKTFVNLFDSTTSTPGTGGGTVTSVAISLPAAVFSVGGAVTSSGTLTATLQTQSANLVWAGPTTGVATTPTFRALVVADLPTSGVTAGTYGTASTIPRVTVDAYGRITAITTNSVSADWSVITSKPTTLSGYGITDRLNKFQASTISNGTAVANSTGETSIFSGATVNGSLTVASLAQGATVKVTAYCLLSTAASAGSLIIKVYLGGSVVCFSGGPITLTNSISAKTIKIEAIIVCRTAGASTYSTGFVNIQPASGTSLSATGFDLPSNGGAVAVGSGALDITAQWGTADPANSIQLVNALVEVVG